jgi:Zn-dependent M28 family amino/carboxypeptidase
MDESRLRQHVEALAGTPRVPGTPEHARAVEYIEDAFNDMGLWCVKHVFEDGSVNIVAEKSKVPTFVVGAHFDSVPGSPGADDNASGVAALLEVAREYRFHMPDSHRIQFVAFDREEDGLIGSGHHCKWLRKEGYDVLGMISLEMLGYKSEGQTYVEGVSIQRKEGDFLALVSNPKSASLLKLFEGIDSPLPYETVTVPSGTEAAMLSRLSDHGSFWDAGWKALLATDTAFLRNPHYHKPTDTPATLDYTFLKQSAELIVKALARISHIL